MSLPTFLTSIGRGSNEREGERGREGMFCLLMVLFQLMCGNSDDHTFGFVCKSYTNVNTH